MRELDELRALSQRIKEIEEKKLELKEMVQPRAQIISDMPRGGNPINTIEEYVIKMEKLDNDILKLEAAKKEIWNGLEVVFEKCGITNTEKQMLRARFYEGVSWKRCAKLVGENENKLFRMYRAVLCKINKYQKETL